MSQNMISVIFTLLTAIPSPCHKKCESTQQSRAVCPIQSVEALQERSDKALRPSDHTPSRSLDNLPELPYTFRYAHHSRSSRFTPKTHQPVTGRS